MSEAEELAELRLAVELADAALAVEFKDRKRLEAEILELKATCASLEADPLPEVDMALLAVPLAEPEPGGLRRHREHWVYFLQGDDGGPVKIGRSLKHPLERCAGVQVGYPFGRLRVVGILRAPAFNEQRLHKAYAHLRIRGEWFRPAPDLVEYIALIGRVSK